MTDDIRDDAASDEEPEATLDATEDDAAETAPTAEEQVDWEKRYREANKALSKQGKELGLLRQEVARMAPAAPEPPESTLPTTEAQELAFYRTQYQQLSQQQVAAEYGPDVVEAQSYYERAVRLDPSPRGRANAFVAAIEMLASSAAEPDTEAPAPKPKPPARLDSNRSDAAPPADLEKVRREAESKKDEKSRTAYIRELMRSAGRG